MAENKSNNSAGMSNKQIEEMAKDILKCGCVGTCLECEYATLAEDDCACIDVKIAEGLYNAGYRKVVEQSETARECKEGVDNGFSSSVTESVTRAEVAREIFEEIEGFNRPPMPECEPVYIIKASEFAELKKKYMEEEK